MEAVIGVGRRVKLSNRLRSTLVKLIAGEKTIAFKRAVAEKRRRLLGKPHLVLAFLELDDPYSYLLAHYLPELAAAYDVDLHYCLAQSNYDEAYRPRAAMLALHAESDCARLAGELGVPFLDRGMAPPVEHRHALVEMLAAQSASDHFDGELLEAIGLYWRGDTEGIARRVAGLELTGRGEALLETNSQRLAKLGHYSCGMLHYGGEWYWGVDRLLYLIERLDDLGARRKDVSAPKLASTRQVMQVQLPIARPAAASELPPLEMFYSLRSPYSYLALQRVFDLCDAFGLRLVVRPVLPMAMRGMQVPRRKLIYIANDTSREARRLGVAFGDFADPLGVGIERCLAVYYYAQSEKRQREFLVAAGEAIWARGIDVATDKGMRKVTARCGLFWPDVVAAMQNDDWRDEVEQNRKEMMGLGSWGVPTLRLGDFVVWGQDRIWLLARHIEERCDAGEGILV